MFGLPNPYIILAFVCALVGVYGYGHHQGYEQKSTEDAVEISRLNAESLEKERRVTEQYAVIDKLKRKAQDDIKAKQTTTDARIDSGELQLPTSGCSVHSASDTASGDGDQGSESSKQILKDINALIAEGDGAIEDYNACVRKYNEVRDTFNKAKK